MARATARLRRPKSKSAPQSVGKVPSGIVGLDEMTGGGLPRGRTTLIEGGPGCGKTILALQTLVHRARQWGEAGIFVAFEESSRQIIANAASFGWDLRSLQRQKLFFLDAQTRPDVLQSGAFDLGGMLATLEAKARQMRARCIVFDAIDVLLSMLADPVRERRELYRLRDWLLEHDMTGLITSKAGIESVGVISDQGAGFIHFMVDCALILQHKVVDGVSQRNLRVLKFRGSAFEENEVPFVIAADGIEVAGSGPSTSRAKPNTSHKRISTGIPRLDAMLGGGLYRGSTVLVTGKPGSAKSTLCGAYAAAACKRGEKVLMVSFDLDCQDVVRNLASVGIHLGDYVQRDQLRIVFARSLAASAEIQLMRIRTMAREHGARSVLIDPVSSLTRSEADFVAHGVAERLLDWARACGITLFCSSLVGEDPADSGSTPLQVSTLADTWIHLSYLVRAGERNRALTIVKSRGTAHSNQVRELILDDTGVTLSDVYTAGGEVLMGTLRWEKEEAERLAKSQGEIAARHERARILGEEAELEARIRSLKAALDAKRAEKTALTNDLSAREVNRDRFQHRLKAMRGADESH